MPWFTKRHRKPHPTTNNVIAVNREPNIFKPLHEPPDVIAASQGVDALSQPDQTTLPFGLHRLDTTDLNSCEGPYCLDITAIHGLNGNAYTTWTKGKGPLWLKEFLPKSLPGARVYTYSYDSKVWSSSKGEVRDWAKNLLSCLHSQRLTEIDQKRGIIFICHSLGGIVCKKALVEANEDPSFSNILSSTKGIIFFGTPHVGSEQADFASMLVLIAESVGNVTQINRVTGQRLRGDLVDLLKRQSKELEELTMSFRNRLKGIEILSFYEQDTMRGLQKLIVPRNSALLNCPGERQHPSPGKDHRTMCRLDRDADEYKVIVEFAKELEQQERRNHAKNSGSWHDSEKEQKCLNALRSVEIEMMERRVHLATPIPGTCDWALRHPSFRAWISSNRSDVLHLTGDMGSGKTTTMSFILDQLKSDRQWNAIGINQKPFTICSFFCSDQHYHFRDGVWILRGILYQLLSQNDTLLQSMHTSIVGLADVPAENWNESLLWPRLEEALNSPLAGPVLLIIDALDECQETSLSLLLENIGRLLNHKSQHQNNCVKVLISSRPTITIKRVIQPFITTVSIDTGEIFKSLKEDVRRLINYEIENLATAGNWTKNMRADLSGKLEEKAGVSFLWARLVLNRMENGSQDVIHLRKVIDESPKDLDQSYCQILAGINDDNQDLATKMLRLLVGSMRPLTTKEFRMALAIISSGNQSLPLEEIEKARDRNIELSIRNVLKSLACVRGKKVELYHSSTKEFLLRLSVGKVNNLESFRPSIQSLYGIDFHDANLDLARACITFLGLEDFNEDMDKTQDETLLSFAELPLAGNFDDGDQLGSPLTDVPVSPNLSPSSSEDESANAGMLSVKDKIRKHLFYAYSATYWTSHLRLVGSRATQALLESSIHISDPNEHCLMNWSDLYKSSSQEWVALPQPLNPLTISAFFGVVSLGNAVFGHSPKLAQQYKSLALCWACRMGHLDVVQMLLLHGARLTEHQLEGRWPISWACANGHKEIVETLLKEDCELQINLPDSKNRSPLSLVVEFGDLEITKHLLAVKGIDVNLADNAGSTPIFWSIGSKMGSNDVKALKKLLAVDEIDILKRDNWGRTVLSWAAEKGALAAINALLHSKRSDIELLLNDTGDNSYGRSPLGYAAFYGHAEVVEALCKTRRINAQLASVDHKGQNAVVLAADRNHYEVIQVLAKYYPQGLDIGDQDGRTPLSAAMWAGESENNIKTIRALINSRVVDVNSKSAGGRTPLCFAAGAGAVSLIRILVEEGNANMDIADNDGVLPEAYGLKMHVAKVKEEFRRLRAARSTRKA